MGPILNFWSIWWYICIFVGCKLHLEKGTMSMKSRVQHVFIEFAPKNGFKGPLSLTASTDMSESRWTNGLSAVYFDGLTGLTFLFYVAWVIFQLLGSFGFWVNRTRSLRRGNHVRNMCWKKSIAWSRAIWVVKLQLFVYVHPEIFKGGWSCQLTKAYIVGCSGCLFTIVDGSFRYCNSR